MKTIKNTGIILVLVIFSLAGRRAEAQQLPQPEQRQTDEQLEREFQQEENKLKIEQRKKEYEMHLKQMEQDMHMKQMEQDMHMKQLEAEAEARERERERSRIYLRHSGNEEIHALPYMFSHGDQTQLTLRNTFRGGTDSSKGEFDVDESTRQIRCMINGKVKSGEIIIKVFYPDGKVFRDMTINSSAEVSFNQSLNIKERDPDKYIGSWKYEVRADKAEGNYMLQISTN